MNEKRVSSIIKEQEKCDLYIAIIDALEKQMPRTVREYVKGGYCCPSCKAIRYPESPYCEHCGQALDWRNQE